MTRTENVESDEEVGLLLHEEMAFLIDENRVKEVEDIFTEMGVMHPILYYGCDICDQTRRTLKIQCENSESHLRTF